MNKSAAVILWWEGKNQSFVLEEGGDDLFLSRSAPTDEGFEYEEEELCLLDGIVYREMQSGGCDCDGRIDHFRKMQCPVEKLSGRISPDGKWRLPEWEEKKAWQHDHEAAKVGY